MSTTLLSASAVGVGSATANAGDGYLSATLSGSGSLSATVYIEGSPDASKWHTMTVFNPSTGTGLFQAEYIDNADAWVRARVVEITGTGATVVVSLGRLNDLRSVLSASNTVVILGPSQCAHNDFTASTGNSLTSIGLTATFTHTSHGVAQNGMVEIYDVLEPQYNGRFIATWLSADTFSYTLPAPAVSPAHGDTVISYINLHRHCSEGWMRWANALSGNRFNVISNAGHGGDLHIDMLNRVDHDVIRLEPRYCFVCASINDINIDVNTDDSISQLQQIYAKLLEAGIDVGAITVPPVDAAYSFYSAARLQERNKMNNWIRSYCRQTKGMHLLDVDALWIDPTAADGAALAAMCSSDHVHYSQKGARKLGQYIADYFQYRIPPNTWEMTSLADTYGTNAASWNLLDVGFFQGTGGSVVGSVTGDVATGWTVNEGGSGSVVASIVADANGYGSAQRMEITAAANNDTIQLYPASIHTRVVAGDVISTQATIKLTSVVNLNHILHELFMTVTGPGNAQLRGWQNMNTVTPAFWDLTDMTLTVETEPWTVPAGVTALYPRVQFIFSGVGGATIDVSRVTVRKHITL